MSSYRRRSYNISNKSERKTSSSALKGNGLLTDNGLESTSVEHLVSSNETELRVNNSTFQDTSAAATLLVYKKLDGQGEELGDDSAADSALCETAQTNIEYIDKEPGKCSEDLVSDFQQRMSENESKQQEEPDEWYEDGNVDPVTSNKPLLKVEEDTDNHQESLKLSGSDNEEADGKESALEDNSNNVSTPEVKMKLDLDQLEEGNSYTEREIYETQLVQLQQQLVETMIKEQETSKLHNYTYIRTRILLILSIMYCFCFWKVLQQNEVSA